MTFSKKSLQNDQIQMEEITSTDCDLCDQSFPDIISLVQHQIWYHGLMEQDFIEVDESNENLNIDQLDGQDQSFDETMSERSAEAQPLMQKVMVQSYNYHIRFSIN